MSYCVPGQNINHSLILIELKAVYCAPKIPKLKELLCTNWNIFGYNTTIVHAFLNCCRHISILMCTILILQIFPQILVPCPSLGGGGVP